MHFTKRWPTLDRVLHKIFIRLGFDVLNIPFGYLQYFEKGKNKSIYEDDFPFPTLFTQTHIVTVLADVMDRSHGDRDLQAYQVALEKIDTSPNLYVSFMGMDEFGHLYGVNSPEYDHMLFQIDTWVKNLVDRFTTTHSNCNVVVFSDHGMKNVKNEVRIEFEKYLGPSNPQTYLYFVDSVMIRVWIYDPAIYHKIEELLCRLGCGTILSQSERTQLGILSSYCGDIIFVLDEGHIFSPSYFGLKKVAAMHGYMPHLESQQAIFLAQGEGIHTQKFAQTASTRGIYTFLLDLF
jgi:hypothetical protein